MHDRVFELTLAGADGGTVALEYLPDVSQLRYKETGEDIRPGIFENGPKTYKAWPVMSPANAPGKSNDLTAIKIQMGFSCNYSCAYCNQASHNHFVGGDLSKVQAFIEKMPAWYSGGPEGDGTGARIEFWGGEPFIYWAHMKALHRGIVKHYPRAKFNVITNGSLLDDEKVNWLIDNDIGCNISHDGPGQKLRHPEDILDDPEKVRVIRRLVKCGNVGFGSVLTRDNMSLAAIRMHIEQKLGLHPYSISHNTEEILLPYDAYGMMMTPQTDAERSHALHTLFWEIATKQTVPFVNSVRRKIDDFFQSLDHKRPIIAVGQKCGMDKEDALAVNLNGDVTTCHNTAADGAHQIGHVDDFENIELTTAYHHQARDACTRCPVVQLCKGSCMFLTGKNWEMACDVSLTYNLAMLAGALYFVTGGLVLTRIDGMDIRGRGVSSVEVLDPDVLMSAQAAE